MKQTAVRPSLRLFKASCLGLWSACLVLALAAPLFADGESRPATKAEQAASLKMHNAMEKALPPGPSGWEETERTEPPENLRVVPGQETFPLVQDYFVHWQDRKRIEAADQKMDEALPAMARHVAPDQEMTGLQDRYEALVQEASAAMEKGDMARFAAIQQDMEALSVQINQKADQGQDAFDREIAQSAPHDVDLKVYLATNRFVQGFMDPLSETSTMAGLPLVRVGDGEQNSTGWHEGYTYVFLGDYSLKEEEGSVRMEAEQKNLPHTAVQTVLVRVQGNKARAQAFLEAVNWPVLKSLLSR